MHPLALQGGLGLTRRGVLETGSADSLRRNEHNGDHKTRMLKATLSWQAVRSETCTTTGAIWVNNVLLSLRMVSCNNQQALPESNCMVAMEPATPSKTMDVI